MSERSTEAEEASDGENSRLLPELMRRAQSGDGVAYDTLLSTIYPILKAFILKRMGHWERADDVVQEILLSIHRARNTYHCDQAFLPWMYSIAQFRLIDYWRKESRITERERHDELALINCVSPKPNGGLPGHFEIALNELPFKQKEAIRLLKVEGFSVREVALQMGLTESDVKVSAHRGYKTLSSILEASLDGD